MTSFSEKNKPLKEAYPRNLLLAALGSWEENNPTELSSDVLAGIEYVLLTLGERDCKVLHMRYREKMTLQQIGEQFGFIAERARQIEVKALRKLCYRKNMAIVTKGVDGYVKDRCELEYERGHQIGYDKGYRDGINDAKEGVTKVGVSVTVSSLPIEALELSLRAYNALKRAGFNTIGDLFDLDSKTIIHIKNLGVQQRKEVASGLRHYGISDTEWDHYYCKEN